MVAFFSIRIFLSSSCGFYKYLAFLAKITISKCLSLTKYGPKMGRASGTTYKILRFFLF